MARVFHVGGGGHNLSGAQRCVGLVTLGCFLARPTPVFCCLLRELFEAGSRPRSAELSTGCSVVVWLLASGIVLCGRLVVYLDVRFKLVELSVGAAGRRSVPFGQCVSLCICSFRRPDLCHRLRGDLVPLRQRWRCLCMCVIAARWLAALVSASAGFRV